MFAEGYWNRCTKCNGTGTIKIDQGLIRSDIVEKVCGQCEGKKEIFTTLNCPFMSSNFPMINNGFTERDFRFAPTQCMGKTCVLWDRIGNDGGCLIRKHFEK